MSCTCASKDSLADGGSGVCTTLTVSIGGAATKGKPSTARGCGRQERCGVDGSSSFNCAPPGACPTEDCADSGRITGHDASVGGLRPGRSAIDVGCGEAALAASTGRAARVRSSPGFRCRCAATLSRKSLISSSLAGSPADSSLSKATACTRYSASRRASSSRNAAQSEPAQSSNAWRRACSTSASCASFHSPCTTSMSCKALLGVLSDPAAHDGVGIGWHCSSHMTAVGVRIASGVVGTAGASAGRAAHGEPVKLPGALSVSPSGRWQLAGAAAMAAR
mmetsp:Transcript_126759/g.370496  ORF Transcript_126759/g.370496 Transcript_126759/m.370496 type:complete len:279 (+) Transcript_126759:927-1763(+)